MTRPMITLAAMSAALLVNQAAGAGVKMEEGLYRAVEASRAGALELLKSIVDIDSGSGDIKGGERVESVLRSMAAKSWARRGRPS